MFSFYETVDFGCANFSCENRFLFDEIKFKKTIQINDCYPIQFQNIMFPETVIFRHSNLSKVSFIDSNLEKVRFDECYWDDFKKLEGRNILWDEVYSRDYRNFWQKFCWGIFCRKTTKEYHKNLKQIDKHQFQLNRKSQPPAQEKL